VDGMRKGKEKEKKGWKVKKGNKKRKWRPQKRK
jgi:hypothetical protein